MNKQYIYSLAKQKVLLDECLTKFQITNLLNNIQYCFKMFPILS